MLAAGSWRAMRHCPGRSIWTGPPDRTPADLVGPGVDVEVFHVAAAPDPVHVGAFAGGGLISYAKPGAGFVHTLNTTDGFARKLAQLGITIDSS